MYGLPLTVELMLEDFADGDPDLEDVEEDLL